MGTKSDCLFHIINLLPKGVQTIFKTFLIEDFFHFPSVSTTPVVHWAVNIYANFQKKIWNAPFWILRGLGETESWKKSEVLNLVALSLSAWWGHFSAFHSIIIIFRIPISVDGNICSWYARQSLLQQSNTHCVQFTSAPSSLYSTPQTHIWVAISRCMSESDEVIWFS